MVNGLCVITFEGLLELRRKYWTTGGIVMSNAFIRGIRAVDRGTGEFLEMTMFGTNRERLESPQDREVRL